MRILPSRPKHTRRPHPQILSHWELGFNTGIPEGHKHSVHSSWEYNICRKTCDNQSTKTRRGGKRNIQVESSYLNGNAGSVR
jgi:hypothetical protein